MNQIHLFLDDVNLLLDLFKYIPEGKRRQQGMAYKQSAGSLVIV